MRTVSITKQVTNDCIITITIWPIEGDIAIRVKYGKTNPILWSGTNVGPNGFQALAELASHTQSQVSDIYNECFRIAFRSP